MTSSRKRPLKFSGHYLLCETDLHPLRKIYQTVVSPRALYGCEFWHDLCESQRLHLERSHRLSVKTMQGIDQRTETLEYRTYEKEVHVVRPNMPS